MGAFIKQVGSLIAGQMAGSNRKATFIVKSLRTAYVVNGSLIAVIWYSAWRNERVAPGDAQFPFPGIKNLKRKFAPDRPEKELDRPQGSQWGTSQGKGAPGTLPNSTASQFGIPTTPKLARQYHGLGSFEGKPVAAWIVPYLEYGRAHGWRGALNQGFRTYAEEVSIWNSGTRPAARPGTSNHGKKNFPGGAVDVEEAEKLAHILSQIPNALLIWAGSKDPVHFSYPHNGSY